MYDVLSRDKYDADVRSGALICLELGELPRDSLDELQRRALETAQACWYGGLKNENARLESLRKVANQCDEDVDNRVSRTRMGYAHGFLFGALAANTGLSIFYGAFIVEIAVAAGLQIDQIEAAFSKFIPTLRRGALRRVVTRIVFGVRGEWRCAQWCEVLAFKLHSLPGIGWPGTVFQVSRRPKTGGAMRVTKN
jgi:hypothetical protein